MKINFLLLALLSVITSKNYANEYTQWLEIKRQDDIIQATHFVPSQDIESELVVIKRITDKTFIGAWLYTWDKSGSLIKQTCLSLDHTTPLISMLKEKIDEYESSGRTDKQVEKYRASASRDITKSQVCSIL